MSRTKTLFLLPLVFFASACHQTSNFKFIVIGDTAYDVPNDYPAYEQLIDEINLADPSFTVHVGDTKSGRDSCNDARQQTIKLHFDLFEKPLIYTPGDNEWTDCHRPGIDEDPNDRLAAIRRIFFPNSFSLGQSPLKLTRQSDISNHRQMVENARWQKQRVMFATVHIPGSNNNHTPPNPTSPPEFDARNAANVEWIEETFQLATKRNMRAIVLFFHANIFVNNTIPSGYVDSLNALSAGARAFSRPILLVHGDTHTYRLDKPLDNRLSTPPGAPLYGHVTRLETFGAPEIKAVQILVEPSSSGVFAINPF